MATSVAGESQRQHEQFVSHDLCSPAVAVGGPLQVTPRLPVGNERSGAVVPLGPASKTGDGHSTRSGELHVNQERGVTVTL